MKSKSAFTQEIEKLTENIKTKYQSLTKNMDKACAPCEDIPKQDNLVIKE